MTFLLYCAVFVAGMVTKVLVPWPWADDKVRALWAKYVDKKAAP